MINPINILDVCYSIALILSGIVGVVRFHTIDKATKIVCLWIWLGGITELLASFLRFNSGNNLPVYSVYSLIELCIIAMYFNVSLKYIKKQHAGIFIIITSILLWVGNTIFLQPINVINSNFIFIECLFIVSLSLYAIYRRFLIYDESLIPNTHFWIPCILVLYQLGTLWNWGFYEYFFDRSPENTDILIIAILGINILTYISFTTILIQYPKMKRSHVF